MPVVISLAVCTVTYLPSCLGAFQMFASVTDSLGLAWSWVLLTFFFTSHSPVHEEDEQKRLLVTVWNRAGSSR